MDSRERLTESAYARESHGRPWPTTIGVDPATGRPFLPITYLSLYTEKKQDRGEDADPLSEAVGPDACVVGVFDGLGGAGATPIETAQGVRTSAFIAARLAREGTRTVVSEALNPQAPPPAPGGRADVPHDRLSVRLAADLRERFGRYLTRTGAPESRIRSALIRPLPTTLAVAVLTARPGRISVRVLWAGDSRVYMLLPRSGLHQLSIDDLKSHGDAMRNLEDDSPLSNLISADGRFEIHDHSFWKLPDQAVIIAATDGCFGYLPTPAHFEDVLLTTMAEAAESGDWRRWQAGLRSRITGYTGDDATLGMACLGWDSLGAMAESFAPRQVAVSAMTRAVDDAEARLAAAVAEADTAKAAYAVTKAGLWDSYRDEYEEFLRMAEEQKKPQPTAVTEPAAPRDGGTERDLGTVEPREGGSRATAEPPGPDSDPDPDLDPDPDPDLDSKPNPATDAPPSAGSEAAVPRSTVTVSAADDAHDAHVPPDDLTKMADATCEKSSPLRGGTGGLDRDARTRRRRSGEDGT